MRRSLPLLSVILLTLALAACSSSSKAASPSNENTTTTSVVPAPAGLPAFYSFSTPIPTTPGALIKSERLSAPQLHGSLYRVLYVSTGVHDEPVPVTGLIAIPDRAPPASGYPVVTWGHGTNGMADVCAPSLHSESSELAGLANMLLDKGWVVTASDYQGEGTPGMMPYIAGESAARNTVDIVRAARELPAAHASDTYIVWGHSEGGQTAMFGLKSAPTYAPELHLKGVVAGAPPSQFNLIYDYLKTSPYKYYLLMAAGGLNTAYGDTEAPLDQVLSPKGVAMVPSLDHGCAGDIQKRFANVTVDEVSTGDPFKVPAWKKLLEANDPEAFTQASPVPLLMIQGGNDEQIPPVSTELLAKHLCAIDQVLSRWIYPGQSHSGVIAPSSPDMVRWMSDRFADKANPNAQAPTGLPNVQVTRCPAANG